MYKIENVEGFHKDRGSGGKSGISGIDMGGGSGGRGRGGGGRGEGGGPPSRHIIPIKAELTCCSCAVSRINSSSSCQTKPETLSPPIIMEEMRGGDWGKGRHHCIWQKFSFEDFLEKTLVQAQALILFFQCLCLFSF